MITQQELTKLQKLSKISFSKHELDRVTEKLNAVIAMINTLKDVDCAGVQPLRSVSDSKQRMREDTVMTLSIVEQLFANVPARNADFAKEVQCFIVPKMIE